MDLAEYLFYETANERKRNGIGDYHKKRRGGRNVRLCSDNLTRKEWEKMNGEVITVNLDQPRTWGEYKELPDNYKKDYMEHLYEKYKATPNMLAAMFRVTRATVFGELNRLDLHFEYKKGKVSSGIIDAWGKFLYERYEIPQEHTEPEKESKLEIKPEPKPILIPLEDTSIRAKLREMFGPGVKFTIEIET